MGYMSFSVFGSDAASDFTCRCVESIAEQMEKEIDKDHGPYNTPGTTNIGLFIREVIHPVKEYFHSNDLIYRMAKHVVEDIDNMINAAEKSPDSVWTSEEDKNWFIEEQKLIKKDVTRYIRYCEKQRPEIKDGKSKWSKKS